MLVSVVIPTFNSEKYVADCLDSVLNQTYKNIEIICVDDGSQDNTCLVLMKYCNNHPEKIKLLKQANFGAPIARNNGLKIAQGEYVQFLDSDDVLLPGKISRQVELILTNKNKLPDFLVGNYFWNIMNKKTFPSDFTHNNWIDLLRGTFGNTCSNLWKRDFIINIGGWSEYVQSSQETELMFRMMKANAFVFYDCVPLAQINVRSSDSISSENRQETYSRFINIRTEIIEYLIDENIITDQILLEFNKIVFNSIRMLYKYNPQKAYWYYKDIYDHKLSLASLQHSSTQYKILYLLLGFLKAEQIAGYFKSI